jgi:hypothetical protein
MSKMYYCSFSEKCSPNNFWYINVYTGRRSVSHGDYNIDFWLRNEDYKYVPCRSANPRSFVASFVDDLPEIIIHTETILYKVKREKEIYAYINDAFHTRK